MLQCSDSLDDSVAKSPDKFTKNAQCGKPALRVQIQYLDCHKRRRHATDDVSAGVQSLKYYCKLQVFNVPRQWRAVGNVHLASITAGY